MRNRTIQTVGEAQTRGYNLMTCVLLGLAGLAFGSVIFAEPEFLDKIDDIVLLGVAAAALIWYLVWGVRHRLTLTPIVLTAIAVVGQFIGILVEHDDSEAFGDNIGGMIIYVGILIVLIVQYVVTARQASASAGAPPAATG